MSTNSDTHHDADAYYVPHGSPWPILGSVALFSLIAALPALVVAAFAAVTNALRR